MSREFGSYFEGYFDYQIETAANDCCGGQDELTRLWGQFLQAFIPVAYAIASSEAGDSSADYPIMETINQLPELRQRLAAIESYIRPFQLVAEEAVKKALKDR